MYCLKCGRKLINGEKRCIDCGMEVANIEYCGGFWGLVGEETKKISVSEIVESKAVVTPQQERIEKRENNTSSGKKSQKKRLKVLVYVLMVFILVSIIQSLGLYILATKYKEISIEYEDAIEKIEEYEAFFEDNISVDELEEYLLSKAVSALSNGKYYVNENSVLCIKGKNFMLDCHYPLSEYGVKNGDCLVLF